MTEYKTHKIVTVPVLDMGPVSGDLIQDHPTFDWSYLMSDTEWFIQRSMTESLSETLDRLYLGGSYPKRTRWQKLKWRVTDWWQEMRWLPHRCPEHYD